MKQKWEQKKEKTRQESARIVGRKQNEKRNRSKKPNLTDSMSNPRTGRQAG
jgi:hypothetical protein